jgi:hypothetical protein
MPGAKFGDVGVRKFMAAGSPCKSNTSKRFWYPSIKADP